MSASNLNRTNSVAGLGVGTQYQQPNIGKAPPLIPNAPSNLQQTILHTPQSNNQSSQRLSAQPQEGAHQVSPRTAVKSEEQARV